MKEISAVALVISLIFTSGCSEKTTTEIEQRNGLYYALNETKPFTGAYKKSYPNGQKELEGNLKGGQQIGLWTTFFENG